MWGVEGMSGEQRLAGRPSSLPSALPAYSPLLPSAPKHQLCLGWGPAGSECQPQARRTPAMAMEGPHSRAGAWPPMPPIPLCFGQARFPGCSGEAAPLQERPLHRGGPQSGQPLTQAVHQRCRAPLPGVRFVWGPPPGGLCSQLRAALRGPSEPLGLVRGRMGLTGSPGGAWHRAPATD